MNRHLDGGRARSRHHDPLMRHGFVHVVLDDHSALAYAEIRDDKLGITATAVLRRAVARFADRGVIARRVLTDSGDCYRSRHWATACTELGITLKRTQPYRPQTNGKVERFNRTMISEWAFVEMFTSEAARRAAFPAWLHTYNHHRPRTGIGGHPPISRFAQPTRSVQLGPEVRRSSGTRYAVPLYRDITKGSHRRGVKLAKMI